MHKYIPIIRSRITLEVLLGFTHSRNLSTAFSPLVEIGHKSKETDNIEVSQLIRDFGTVFVDYPYFRANAIKGDWRIDLETNIIDRLKEISYYKDFEGNLMEYYNYKPVPVISGKTKTLESAEAALHYSKIYEKALSEGFKKAAFRIPFKHQDPFNFKAVERLAGLGDNFFLIDSLNAQVEPDKIERYDDALLNVAGHIKNANSNVEIIVLNSKFRVKQPDGEWLERLHWPTLKDRLDAYGFGDYITEFREGGGRPSTQYSIYYYDYSERITLPFRDPESIENVFEKMESNDQVMNLIQNHSSYCEYCQKLRGMIKNKKEDEDFKRRKGELGRIHQFNSISVNELNYEQPHSY